MKRGGVTSLSKELTAAQKLIGDFALKLVDLNGPGAIGTPGDLQTRRQSRNRGALIAMNRPDQLRFHLNYAVENEVKKEELIEIVTHLAFYSCWPNAMSAITFHNPICVMPLSCSLPTNS
jgi:4-carboxymuconolactone decarboxylase